MSSIIFRYLATSFIFPLVLSSIFFVLFLLTFQLLTLSDFIFGSGLKSEQILGLLFDMGVVFIPLALPISIYFSSLYCFSKLSNDSEYVALRSFGYTKIKIYLPFLFCSLFLAFNLYFLNQEVIPLAKRSFKKVITELKSESITSNLKSGHFFSLIPGVTLFAEIVEEGGERIKNIFISVAKSSGEIQRTVAAQRARFFSDPENGELRLILESGNILTVYPDERREKIFFDRYDYPIPDLGSYALTPRANTMTGSELRKVMKLKDAQWESLGMDFEEYRKTFFEYWNRVNTPMLCLVLSFLGYTLGAQANRRQKNKTTSMALFILILYYGVFFFFVSQSNQGKISSSVAVFLPTLLLMLVTLRFYKKLDWAV